MMKYIGCSECETGVVGVVGVVGIRHLRDGAHELVYETPRPEYSTVAMWSDIRAALTNINQVEFYCGFLPEKPTGVSPRELEEIVRLQLDDARRVLGQLADHLADGAAS